MSFRLAFRTLRRSPWYAATVIGTIALSISLAATVFAVVDGVLFRPLPYAAPERLYQLVGSAGPGETASLSPTDVRYLNEADPRVSVTGFGRPAGLTHPDRPDLTIWSATIDARFFDVLGQYPLVGGFGADHFNQPAPVGEARPAIVSHGFWRQWLAADPSVLGRRVEMVGAPLTVVGVLPRDFVFPDRFGRVRPDVLFPLTTPPTTSLDRGSRSLNAVARLDETITADEAKSALSAMLAARVNEYPPGRRLLPGPYVAVVMQPLEMYLGRSERPLFRLAFAGAALLMILGAINVAGLLAARGRERARELTVRVALGAGRVELARLMMSEALLVALLGSGVGLALSQPLLAMTLQLLPESLLLLKSPVIDWRVVVFAVLTAGVVVSAFALGPAAALARAALSQRLSGGLTTTARVRSWSGSALLAAESAIGVALVLAGSLVLASFIVLRGEDAGFDASGLAILDIRTSGATTPDEVQARHLRVLERMRLSPGVSGVAAMGVPLLENMFGGTQFAPPPGANGGTNDIPVSGAFFGVAGLEVLDGRVLTDMEIEAGRPFAVVSELTARQYWPSGRAVGETLASTDRPVTVTVVGVVEEARFGSQEENWHGEIYLPASLSRSSAHVYLLRTAGDPDMVIGDVALALQRDVPGVLVRRAESFDDALLKSIRLHRFRSVLFGVSASAGLLLLAVGIGGLVATAVVRRTREIGVRSALGARRHQLVSMVIIDHLRPSLVGVGLGLLASWWTTQLLSAFLYQIDAHEPTVWFAAATSLIAVAVVAAWIPARRASTVDAMTVLKAE